jgi:2-dehydropantoate 2-reductase
MNVLVLGPGAIGSLWAVKLYHAGHSVSVWTKHNQPSFQVQFEAQPPLLFRNHCRKDVHQADLILVTVKAWQVSPALREILPDLQPESIIVFIHNGMGATKDVLSWLPDQRLLLATTTHGALKTHRQSFTQIRHTGEGQTIMGAITPQGQQCRFLCDILHHALPSVQWYEPIEHILWQKLAVNCVINPLTALNQCANGALAEIGYKTIISHLIEEIAAVMAAENIPVQIPELTRHIEQIIRATAENYSSMHQDLMYHRKTEIDCISGYLIQMARKHQISVPYNEDLYCKIKQLEHQTETQEDS